MGPAALMFSQWSADDVAELDDHNNYVEQTDTGSKLAIFKSAASGVVSIKNNSSGTYTLNITALIAGQG